jgi:hypothetical protein
MSDLQQSEPVLADSETSGAGCGEDAGGSDSVQGRQGRNFRPIINSIKGSLTKMIRT